jgi:hypothetical protein
MAYQRQHRVVAALHKIWAAGKMPYRSGARNAYPQLVRTLPTGLSPLSVENFGFVLRVNKEKWPPKAAIIGRFPRGST